jgi:serine/threonine-protein kinase RsbW
VPGRLVVSGLGPTSWENAAVMSSSVHAPVTMRLPFAASSVSMARQRLRSYLTERHSTREAVEDARVVVSELVANSVRHARPLPDGNLLVSWALAPGGLQLSVTDGGSPTRPRTVHAPSSALAGRGMAIVETLAQDWWTDRTPSRTTVHALLAVPSD